MITRSKIDRRLVLTLRYVFGIAGIVLLVYCFTSFASNEFDLGSKLGRRRIGGLLLQYIFTMVCVTLAFTLGKLESDYTRIDRAIEVLGSASGGVAAIAITILWLWP